MIRRKFAVLTVATLTTLNTIGIDNRLEGDAVYVKSIRDYVALDRTSSLTPDGITVVATVPDAQAFTYLWVRLGIPSKSWLTVGSWYVDPVSGNDELDGQAQTTSGTAGPLKTMQEWNRRIAGRQLMPALSTGFFGGAVFLHLLGDTPVSDHLDLDFAIGPSRQFWIRGGLGATSLQTGTFTAVTAMDPTVAGGGTPLQVTDSALPAANSWTGLLNRRIRITSGANVGAICYVAKDQGSKQARVSPLLFQPMVTATDGGSTTAFTPKTLPIYKTAAVNDPYIVEKLPQLNIGICNLKFNNYDDGSLYSGAAVYIDSVALQGNTAGGVSVNFALRANTSYGSWETYSKTMPIVTSGCEWRGTCTAQNVWSCNDVWLKRVSVDSGLLLKSGGLAAGNQSTYCSHGAVFGSNMDALWQGCGIAGINLYLQSCAVFDVVGGNETPGGHGIVVGVDFANGIALNQIGRSLGGKLLNSNLFDTTAPAIARLWGSGNGGVGVWLATGAQMVIDKSSSVVAQTPVITGTLGDLGAGMTSGSPPNMLSTNQTTGVTVGSIAPSWANLITNGNLQYKNAAFFVN